MSNNGDFEPLIEDDNKAPEVPTRAKKSWSRLLNTGVIATVCIIAALCVVNLQPKTAVKTRLQLASEGTLMYSSLSTDEKASLFDGYKQAFRKSYPNPAEEAKRYNNFLEFLEIADERNAAEQSNGGTAVHGVTKFSDLTQEEFEAQFLGFNPNKKVAKKSTMKMKQTTPKKYAGSETSVDWYMVYTTAVKDQGYCGSCWAFSATEQIESDSIRAGILSTSDDLSVQQIVSCDTLADGCDGGNTVYAYEYVYEAGGIETNATYPYSSYWDVTGTCSDADDYVVTISDAYTFDSSDVESSMEDYVLSTGPISVCLDASSWASYSSGILSTCGTSVDHCVQVTGVNLDDGYWVVRNSWGTEWGLDGFIHLKTGVNLCDITYLPTYTSAELV